MKTIRYEKYNIVFLISGQSLSFSEEMIKQIKECQLQAKFVLYQWDSQKNFPFIKIVHKYFDKCYSFDRYDTDKNPYLKFLPLFYSREYEEMGKIKQTNYKYDFCFIGTAHPLKYKFIKMMAEQLKSIYSNQFIYFFYPSPIVFIYRKIRNPELKKAHYKEFHFAPLKGHEMHDIFVNSRCILDSPQSGQLGLTIRVLEALGAKKKLITTNKDIVNYDFYHPENIYVYDGKVDLENIFFTSEYFEIDYEIYKKYSLESWLKEILS